MRSSICHSEDTHNVHFYWPLQFFHASCHSTNAAYVSVIRDQYNRSIWSCYTVPDWYNLTHCQLDVPSIKYPPVSRHFYTLKCCNPALYSQLQCDCIHDTPEHSTEQSACTEYSSSYLSGISRHKTLCEAKQHGMYKCILFHFTSCVLPALYCVLQDTTRLPPTPATILFSV